MAENGYPGVLTSEGMVSRMRRYFDACNAADVEGVAACFEPDAVHYFPPGMYGGPFRGARTIGERWAAAVERLGSIWTVDNVVADPSTGTAVMEWTHFKTFEDTVLRGDEWYVFDPTSGLIREIRAYYASPQDRELERLELGGFPYTDRGYPTEPPFSRA
jgi:methyltransferase